MTSSLLKLIAISILIYAIVGQNFPPIDSFGYLYLDWYNTGITDNSIKTLMTKFQQTYAVKDLKKIQIGLLGNDGLTTLDAFSVLGTYTQLTSIIYILGQGNSKPTVSGGVNFPANNQVQYLEMWIEDYTPSDWKQFFYNLRQFSKLTQLVIGHFDSGMTQTQHDAFYSYIPLYVNSNIQFIDLEFYDADNIANTYAISNLQTFTKLTNLTIVYSQNVVQSHVVHPIYQFISTQKTLRNINLRFDVYTDSQWAQYVQNFGHISHFDLLMGFCNDSSTQIAVPMFFQYLANMTNLHEFDIEFDQDDTIALDGKLLLGFAKLQQLERLKFNLYVFRFTNMPMSFLNSLNNLVSVNLQLYPKTFDASNFNIDLVGQNLNDYSIQLGSMGSTTQLKLPIKIESKVVQDIQIQLYGEEYYTDIQSMQLQNNNNLTKFSIEIWNYGNFQLLDLLKNSQNIQEIDIDMSCSVQDQYNMSFYSDFNYLKDLQLFGRGNMTHSYIVVDPSYYSFSILTCNDECGRCFGPDNDQCVSCLVNYLYQAQCLATCPQGYHPNVNTHTCDPNTTVQDWIKSLVQKL